MVGPVSTSTATSGMGLIDDVVSLSAAIRDGNWVDAALAGLGTAMDALGTAIDPLGSLIAWGVGWLLDHLSPLKDWLDDLTGNPGAVLGFAGTWSNVATALDDQAQQLAHRTQSELAGMFGPAITAYTDRANHTAATLNAIAHGAGAISTCLQMVSTLVQVVHDLVRDTISQVIGSCTSAIAWAATGIGIPYAISIVSEKAAALSAKISAKITGLVRSIGKLDTALTTLGKHLDELKAALKDLLPGHVTPTHGLPGDGTPGDGIPGDGPGPIRQTGGANRPANPWDVDAQDAWARARYDDFLADGTDVDAIAAGLTGERWSDGRPMTAEDIEAIKDHLMRQDHPLTDDESGGTVNRPFDPDADIAEAWDRLRAGRGTPNDILLLEHERAEAAIMAAHPGMTYSQAHHLANQQFNWQETINYGS